VSSIERQAFWRKLLSNWFGGLLLLAVVSITVALVVLYPCIACTKRMEFVIGAVWPGGAIVILIPVLTDVVKDLRKNIGLETYFLIKENIDENVLEKADRNKLLDLLLTKLDALKSSHKASRWEALDNTITTFQNHGWQINVYRSGIRIMVLRT
jgi:hypothetical protein